MPKGRVFVDRLPGRNERIKWPEKEGALRFNVCSSSPQKIEGHPLKQLSPFFVGPIKMTLPGDDMGDLGTTTATCVENYWQASKVWADEASKPIPKPVKKLIREHGADDYWERMHELGFHPHHFIPTSQWFARRQQYWQDPTPHRRVKRGTGKNNDDPPYCWWLGDALPYVEARCKMYIPIYADLVAKTPAFQALKRLVDGGQDVLLLGFDGYPLKEPLIEYLRNRKVRFGHELVLAAMLRDEAPWEELYPNIERVWEVPETLVPVTDKPKEPVVKVAKRKAAQGSDGKTAKKAKK